MQHDAARVEETAEWVKKSRKDLRRAEAALSFDPPDTEDCLFHCQQAAEKSLKAFLVWRDQPFRKTHDLVELSRQCADLEPSLNAALHGLGPLTRFAWEFRYPGGGQEPSLDKAKNWLAKVMELLHAVESQLPDDAVS